MDAATAPRSLRAGSAAPRRSSSRRCSFFAMLLVVAVANRNLVVEQRASANQYRSTQAFEAAEAGLEWALARLNDTTPIGADCLPSADPARTVVPRPLPARRRRRPRRRHLGRRRHAGAAAAPPACAATSGWNCSCPANGAAVVAAPDGTRHRPGVQRSGSPAAPGPASSARSPTGCTAPAASPAPRRRRRPRAAARLEVALGLVAGAARRAGRGADGRAAASTPAPRALGVHNRDAATGGIALHAGGGVAGERAAPDARRPARRSTARSSPATTPLAALAGDRFFAALVRHRQGALARAAGRRRGVDLRRALRRDDRRRAVAATAAPARASTATVALDGPVDARLAGATRSSSSSPAPLRLRGAVARPRRRRTPARSTGTTRRRTGALVRGAVLVDGDYRATPRADLVHDAARARPPADARPAASPASTAAGRTSEHGDLIAPLRRAQRGTTLIEALRRLLVLAGRHPGGRRSCRASCASTPTSRGSAPRRSGSARARLEPLRAFVGARGGVRRQRLRRRSSTRETTVDADAGYAGHTRYRIVRAHRRRRPSRGAKARDGRRSHWNDRGGAAQRIVLDSVIARSDPALVGRAGARRRRRRGPRRRSVARRSCR